MNKDESVSDLQIFIQLSFPLYFHYELNVSLSVWNHIIFAAGMM